MFADTNLFLRLTRRELRESGMFGDLIYLAVRPRVICADGFTISIQASSNHYCFPRDNDTERYEAVELGYPSEAEDLILDYAEDPEYQPNTVYPNVPVTIVDQILKKHGGIVDISCSMMS